MDIYQENSVEDVSRYVIECSIENNLSITNLRLQKLLYFLQGFRLVDSSGTSGIFKESIVAWQFGPVVKESYFLFNKFGANSISDYSTITKVEVKEGHFEMVDSKWINPLSSNEISFITNVVVGLQSFSDSRLVSITHDANGPWAKHYEANESNIIPKKEIYDYFLNKTR